MQKLKVSFSVAIFLLMFIKNSYAIVFSREDTNYLNNSDKKEFLQKCNKNKIEDNLECLNFLAIKIFLNSYKDEKLTKEKKIIVKKKSIKYLEYAASLGYKDAYLNLGWIYSNEEFDFYNLEKSSNYFKKAHENSIKIKKNVSKNIINVNQSKLSNSNKGYVSLAITLMQKLFLYYNKGTENNHFYLSKNEFEEANNVYKKIIGKSNISDLDFRDIKKKVIEDNKIIISFLKVDINNFDEQFRLDALEDLKKLKNIYTKLI